jgi:hypothetical protein
LTSNDSVGVSSSECVASTKQTKVFNIVLTIKSDLVHHGP